MKRSKVYLFAIALIVSSGSSDLRVYAISLNDASERKSACNSISELLDLEANEL